MRRQTQGLSLSTDQRRAKGPVGAWHLNRGDPVGLPQSTAPFPPLLVMRRQQGIQADLTFGRFTSLDDSVAGRIQCLSCLRQLTQTYVTLPTYSSCLGIKVTLFLHEHRAVGGKRPRLLAATFDATTFIAGDPQPVVWKVYSPGMLFWPALHGTQTGLGFSCAPSEPLRLHFGQPDPADESHFTIQYDAGDRRGVLDGWLQPDDTIKLAAHDAALSSATQIR